MNPIFGNCRIWIQVGRSSRVVSIVREISLRFGIMYISGVDLDGEVVISKKRYLILFIAKLREYSQVWWWTACR